MLFQSPGRAGGTQTHFPVTPAVAGRAVSPCHCPQLSTRGMMSPGLVVAHEVVTAAPSAASSMRWDTAKLVFHLLMAPFGFLFGVETAG